MTEHKTAFPVTPNRGGAIRKDATVEQDLASTFSGESVPDSTELLSLKQPVTCVCEAALQFRLLFSITSEANKNAVVCAYAK